MFNWLAADVLTVSGIITLVLLIGLIIVQPLGGLIAALILLVIRAYVRWAKRYAKKHRPNT
jgi:hypothetical protein